MPEDDIEGYVHSIETAGTVDGPGLRYVVFLSGCPLRCLYCHNPDTRRKKQGKLTRASTLITEMAHYRDFLLRTGGGVTLSGGEPLAQPAFATALLQEAKGLGLSTALDTSGFLGERADAALLNATDLVLLDIKSFDPDTYLRVTGVDLSPTIAFAERLGRLHKPMWIRCVLVPGLTDDEPTFERLATFLAHLPSVERIEVLPFHKMGEPKWKDLGLTYTLTSTPPPTPEQTERVRAIFRAKGLTIV